MRKIYFLFVSLFFAGAVLFAQENIDVPRVSCANAPTLDGLADDWAWTTMEEGVEIAKQFTSGEVTEEPTFLSTPTWKAVWCDTAVYVLLTVEDDDHYPAYEVEGAADWQYDKPEIYFEVNAELTGGGAGTADNGSWQSAPPFVDGVVGTIATIAASGTAPLSYWAYTLVDEGYVAEYCFPLAGLLDAEGTALTTETAVERVVGFDITVIDQDEGVTTGRQRAVWTNDGIAGETPGESWNTMSGAGTLTLTETVISSLFENKASVLSSYPNPVNDVVTINADFDKVVISNVLGQEVKSVAVKNNRVDISELNAGIYVINAYKEGKLQGVVKVVKD
ncbi:MAG: T9SS type A sorting domain-containing protein [Bacteroidales bacterium]|nr:T9SS type A sorting domain-containing protein [Bacteroidales bacterium]